MQYQARGQLLSGRSEGQVCMLPSLGVSITSTKTLAWMKNPIAQMAMPMPCVHVLPTLVLTRIFYPGVSMRTLTGKHLMKFYGCAHMYTHINMQEYTGPLQASHAERRD